MLRMFLERSLVFPILLFSSIYLHSSLRRLSYLSLLFFGTLHSEGYIFPFLLFVLPLTTSLLTIKLKEKSILIQGWWCFQELKEEGLHFKVYGPWIEEKSTLEVSLLEIFCHHSAISSPVPAGKYCCQI